MKAERSLNPHPYLKWSRKFSLDVGGWFKTGWHVLLIVYYLWTDTVVELSSSCLLRNIQLRGSKYPLSIVGSRYYKQQLVFVTIIKQFAWNVLSICFIIKPGLVEIVAVFLPIWFKKQFNHQRIKNSKTCSISLYVAQYHYKFLSFKRQFPVQALFLPAISLGKRGLWILPKNSWRYQNRGYRVILGNWFLSANCAEHWTLT